MILQGGLVGAASLLAMQALAGTKQTVLRFGGPMPLTTNYGKAMLKFKEEVASRSGGSVEVQVYPSSQLGGLKDMVTAVQLGTQSMVMATPAWMAGFVRQLDVLSLLYLPASQERLFASLDGSFGDKLEGYAEAVGLKIVGWWNSGPRHVIDNVRPIHKPADMAGMKLRSQTSQVWLQCLRALGCNPVSLDYPEIYLALQQHTIDGFENPAPDVVGGKFYEVTKYISLTSHLFDVFIVAMNKRQWDGLSSANQKAVAEAMEVATKFQREAQLVEADEAVKFLRTKVEVNDISERDRQLFAEKVRPVYSKFDDTIGKDLIAEAIKEFG
ncbi:MAG: TRAP transporter substrate-binding protein [Rhizobiales bacterium]|nr:TRAP transporter substrate-binding protein [Hyphomicrobiales bacterium]